MSRRFSQSQRPRVTNTSDHLYQGPTKPFPHPHLHSFNPNQKNGYIGKDNRLATSLYRNAPSNVVPSETCLSEDTFTETHSYYDYYHDHGYQTGNRKDSRTDYTYSDESESTRLPYYEYEDVSVKRQSRNTASDRSYTRRGNVNHDGAYKDVRKVYPNQENICERVCFEGGQRCLNDVNLVASLPRRAPISRISDRPQSAQSSSVTSTVVHGCGGRCQTFESVCYYFLQVAFTMGILIGTSLSIAGAVLRKSAARNLQVLVYIGAMLSLVSALLLSVQCSAKHSAQKRKKAMKNTKRAPIQLEQLPSRSVQYQQQPLMENNTQSGLPVTIIPVSAPVHQVPRPVESSPMIEQPGVPWWRRKDLVPSNR